MKEAPSSALNNNVESLLERERQKYMAALEDSNRHLDDFVYIISHDLKEPIRGISSYAQFMLEDYADKLDEDGVHKLNTMIKVSQRMNDLIDKLLYFSRLNRTELAYADLDLNFVVKDIIQLLEPFITEHKINIKIDSPLPITKCDQARAGEVFRNLITNAIKYNDKNIGEKYVQIGATQSYPGYEGQSVFYVKDNGIGIAEQHFESIFKIFKRLHGRDAYGGGTGSGLAIAKKIVAQHKGKIWLESQIGNGTSFFFTLADKKME